MVPLTSPYWEAVSPEMRDLMRILGRLPFLQRFYLAGGTALALQIGHRRSIDLDFFSETDEVDERSRGEILRALAALQVQVIENTGGNLLLLANGIRTGFFSYGYPLVKSTRPVENIALASLEDIGLMKCDALNTRGSRKDFYDLYYLSRHISIEQLLEFSAEKYAYYRDFPLMVLESMTLFDAADRDIQPELLEDLPWEAVKLFFVQQARKLSQSWFDQGGPEDSAYPATKS
jgi:predicted nucleotidyltransferase component of viral defense system